MKATFGVFDQGDHSGCELHDHIANRLKLVQRLDNTRFYAYQLAEHHHSQLSYLSPVSVFLSAACQATRAIRLGSLIYVSSFHHPLRIIEDVCMLDQLSRGRFLLGLGRGGTREEFQFYGMPYDRDFVKLRHSEFFEVVKRGLSNPTLNFGGEHFKLDNIPMLLRPYQEPHPPLWCGVSTTASAEWAAENSVNAVMIWTDAQSTRKLTDAYRRRWHSLGRTHESTPYLGITRYIVLANNEKDAQHLAIDAYASSRRSVEWLPSRAQNRVALAALRHGFPVDFRGIEEMGLGFAGTPDKASNYIRSQLEISGANYLTVQIYFGSLPFESVMETVRLMDGVVIPEVIAS